MMWQSHAAVGGNVVWILVASGLIQQPRPVLVILAAFAALLPDIEARDAKIHHLNYRGFKPFYLIGDALKLSFSHRGVIHSLAAIWLVFILSVWLLRDYSLDISLALTLGYASHPVIDGFNKPGVQYLWPLKKRFKLLPRLLQFNVGSAGDFLLFFLGSLGIAVMLVLEKFA